MGFIWAVFTALWVVSACLTCIALIFGAFIQAGEALLCFVVTYAVAGVARDASNSERMFRNAAELAKRESRSQT